MDADSQSPMMLFYNHSPVADRNLRLRDVNTVLRVMKLMTHLGLEVNTCVFGIDPKDDIFITLFHFHILAQVKFRN